MCSPCLLYNALLGVLQYFDFSFQKITVALPSYPIKHTATTPNTHPHTYKHTHLCALLGNTSLEKGQIAHEYLGRNGSEKKYNYSLIITEIESEASSSSPCHFKIFLSIKILIQQYKQVILHFISSHYNMTFIFHFLFHQLSCIFLLFSYSSFCQQCF